ncbi:hypothetical protein [Actinophytocola algeriensis]|uniref:Uncharacterized protein n=1 Tax=Actinophytocola algeriensis TaxID=1768010 RepID=A0A7W7VG94_9PSEU|nr:hypothetical protein [Actinophytocola algeriensis]MBB4908924.1 hypothetical protein [Actinophytocola algeriensis]MBE1474688.1 hypothetical protein [Actinophytocola algeriensis]
MRSTVSEAEFRETCSTVEPRLRNREEMAYYRLWSDALDEVRTTVLGQSPVMS